MFASDLFHLAKAVSLTSEFGRAAFCRSCPFCGYHPERFNYGLIRRLTPLRTFRRRNSRRSSVSGRSPARHFLWRNFPGGGDIRPCCVLRSPCLFGEREEIARTLFPIHMIWHRVIAGLPRHGLLSPSLTRPNFNRLLKRNMAAAGFPGAERYTPHCFRRGSAQEMQMAGNPEQRIIAAGPLWGSEAISIP